MAWMKLTSKALYLIAGGTYQYIDKIELGSSVNGEYQLTFPVYWFQGQDSPPRRMSVNLNETREPTPLWGGDNGDTHAPNPPTPGPMPDYNGDYYEARVWPWVVVAPSGLNCRADAELSAAIRTGFAQGTVIESSGWKADSQGRPWLYIPTEDGYIRSNSRFIQPAY
ncbi:hypothetical protein IQ235_14045 [Oscillatoriales cyanobacterium LEGE 11467]|uniref:Uncharacterized protein n=1 Tax=Zarconia navalis LEGE 11467 TaxID=1828826 RepID=A0A928W271_9CYAN|nr:hypothetical protein [Zarconia navalis]MBE9041900.1 hypothetical protein [Zarconia navalis LEGE 11467]